jgi:hypothetical protein
MTTPFRVPSEGFCFYSAESKRVAATPIVSLPWRVVSLAISRLSILEVLWVGSFALNFSRA